MKKITKLVLPVAGLGKRLMPLTKNLPKALVAVCGKPLLEYVLDEAVDCGIKDAVLVINPKHEAHFKKYLNVARKKFPQLRLHVRVQHTPGGNGHAVVQAHDIIGNDPFALRFADDILAGDPPALRSLIDAFEKTKSSVILLERVPKKMVSHYGVVSFDKNVAHFEKGNLYRIRKIIEKPKMKEAPSNLTIVGGYVLTGDVVRNLKMVADTLPNIADDALPIAVALQIEFVLGNKVYGWEFPGARLDCGTLDKLKEAESFLSRRRA